MADVIDRRFETKCFQNYLRRATYQLDDMYSFIFGDLKKLMFRGLQLKLRLLAKTIFQMGRISAC